jgi:uncharacterized protein (TIGR02145 family)
MLLFSKNPLCVFLFAGLLNVLGTSCNEDKLFSEFVDARDGKVYKVMRVGGNLWFAEDLNLNDTIYYSYQQALNACPEGWSLPVKEDWIGLAEYFGGYRYNGTDIGDPRKAFTRMISEFGAKEDNAYWTSTPAWDDAASIRSSFFYLNSYRKELEYGATLVGLQLGCRCISRPTPVDGDNIIQFTINNELQTFSFYRIDWDQTTDQIHLFLHRKLNDTELVNRVQFKFKVPETFILAGDAPVVASTALFEHQLSDAPDWSWISHYDTSSENLVVTITFYDGSVVKGQFSGIGFDSVPIENGSFELKVNK